MEEFKREANQRGLKEDTVQSLIREGIETTDVLTTVDPADIDTLKDKLNLGQRSLLKCWIKELNSDIELLTSKQTASSVLPSETLTRDSNKENQEEVTGHDVGKVEYSSSELSDHLSNLELKQKQVDEVGEFVTEHGPADINAFIQKQIADVPKETINIGVTGQSGSGKSSLINSLRSLKANDKGAAKTGTKETTFEVIPYPFPSSSNVVLWDLPGVNTPNFPKKDYIDKVGLLRFDHLIICNSTRFMENDAWLAEEAQRHGIAFCFVRTKIDLDIVNAFDDDKDASENIILRGMKANVYEHLQNDGLPTDGVFLVSSRLQYNTKWDYPELIDHLLKTAKKSKVGPLLEAFIACSTGVIDKKKDELKSRIPIIAEKAAQGGGLSVVREEIENCMHWFGLSEEVLAKFDVDILALDSSLKDIHRELEAITIPGPGGEFTAIGSVIGTAIAPGLGTAFGYIAGLIIDNWKKDTTVSTKEAKEKLEMDKRNLIRTQSELVLGHTLDACVKLAHGVLKDRDQRTKCVD